MEQLVQMIAHDEPVKTFTINYRHYLERGDLAQAVPYKNRAPCFAVAATFHGGKRAECITGCTFLSLVDMDKLATGDVQRLWQAATDDPHTLLAYPTISGHGLRIIFRYTTERTDIDLDELFRSDPERAQRYYTQAFRQGNAYYSALLGTDTYDDKCKDITRLSGLAHCPHVHYNPDAVPLSVTLKEEEKEKRSTSIGKALPLVRRTLEERGLAYEPGSRNEYISQAGYLLNQYGVSLKRAVKWAQKEFADYHEPPGVESILRSCYRQVKEHGSLPVPRGGGGNASKYASVEEIESFLKEQTELRFNVITRICELKWKDKEEEGFGELTDRDGNTLWSRMNKQVKPTRLADLYNVLHSEFVPEFNPFRDYFHSLPPWDGHTDHIAQLAQTVHLTDTSQSELFLKCLRKWLVAMVPTLLEPHVINHEILVLVGRQGVFKTTWFRYLLPPTLQRYFYTKTNSNRFNKDDQFTLAEFALMCFEEIESMNRSELNQLKAMITLDNINERAAYGRNKEHRAHIASFCGTGNNIQFLSDPTGTRRWLPFEVENIDDPYTHPVDYTGVYSQAFTLWKSGFKYWFNQEEIAEVNRHNEYFEVPRIEEELIFTYFRKPLEGEECKFMTVSNILERINAGIRQPLTPSRVGVALRKLGFVQKKIKNQRGYLMVERTQEQVKLSLNSIGHYLKDE